MRSGFFVGILGSVGATDVLDDRVFQLEWKLLERSRSVWVVGVGLGRGLEVSVAFAVVVRDHGSLFLLWISDSASRGEVQGIYLEVHGLHAIRAEYVVGWERR